MIEGLIMLFLLPLVMFIILAWLPPGPPAAFGVAVAVMITALTAAAIYPIGPSQGPDDWFHGIEELLFWGFVLAIAITAPAQLWRWLRLRAKKPSYDPLGILLMILIAAPPILLRL